MSDIPVYNLTDREKREVYDRAYEGLSPEERSELKRIAIDPIKDEIDGVGRKGAIEIAAQLGIFIGSKERR